MTPPCKYFQISIKIQLNLQKDPKDTVERDLDPPFQIQNLLLDRIFPYFVPFLCLRLLQPLFRAQSEGTNAQKFNRSHPTAGEIRPHSVRRRNIGVFDSKLVHNNRRKHKTLQGDIVVWGLRFVDFGMDDQRPA